MASGERGDEASRRQARASWPVTIHRLGDDLSDDLSEVTTPTQRVAMMAELAQSAWAIAGRPMPTYERRSAPTRFIRPGEPRPDADADDAT